MEREKIGVVDTPTATKEFSLILAREEDARVGEYCLVKHPKEDLNVLCRIVTGAGENPALKDEGTTLLAAKGLELGRERECVRMRVEVLGYIKDGRFKPLDFPPLPGQAVYRAYEEDVRPFYQSQDGIQLYVGRDPYSGLNISLSLDWITKGHLGVYGQTRSGKTSFVLRLIKSGMENNARFVIHDRYGEYSVLEPFGVRLDYKKFFSVGQMSVEQIAQSLGFELDKAPGKAAVVAIRWILYEGLELTPENIIAVAYEKAKTPESTLKKMRAVLGRPWIREMLERISNQLSGREEPPKLVELLDENQIVIVDYSTDSDIMKQQRVFAQLIGHLFHHAVRGQGETFTCINVVEEAQFWAPERGMPSFGDPWKTGASTALGMGISQLGGYNVGFVVMTQRPSYVSKAVLTQCNTHICFRVMSSADHAQISGVTGYPSWALREILPTLETRRLSDGSGITLQIPELL